MAGLTTQGLLIATLNEIREEINAQILARISATLDVTDRSLEGQLSGIVSEALSKLWELLEILFGTMDPDKAEGAALDALCLLTGTFRAPASFSTVTLTFTGDPATFVPTGTIARVEDGPQFETAEDVTLVALDAWLPSTAYVVGDRVTNSSNAYVCIESGTSDVGGGPTTESDDITDNTVHWRFMGVGTAAADAEESVATETGPLNANSGTIVEMVTPVGGVDGVINLLDAAVGRDQMSDAELRILRELELAQPGTSTVDAIRAALLNLAGVTAVTVFVNNTDLTDSAGVPPHAIEALVQGGEDQDIWDALLANVAAGILTYGTEEGISTDSQGIEHNMEFSRPEEIEIYIRIYLAKDPDTYPADGDDQVEQAIVDWGDAQATGKDAVASAIAAQAFNVDGVLAVDDVLLYDDVIGTPTVWAPTTAYVATPGARDVVTNDERFYICTTGGTSDVSGGPTGTGSAIVDGTVVWSYLGSPVTITLRQLATYDTSRITVISSDDSP